ncbi:AlpA family phage regulatory protein [Photobacterium aquimaris]|uniref:AlpA family phage regulatory protein n=1 Tax=Photobacterium aquimaris TaxID=512643 RepID=A0A2T3IMR8_9GAMM|nr:AlpA family phage regulatory protein [Photobacterium aquimaris]OBU14754.1 hypothetical protein AYY20_07750 [Photobacterium aquimaris]PSU29637.1 AlpA family phage regulatory protein [Photobacterium aquimaris]
MVHQKIITQAQLAVLLHRSKITIWRWIKDGVLPQPMRINGTVLGWHQEIIDEWLKSLNNSK